MFNWFRKRKTDRRDARTSQNSVDYFELARVKLQQEYWTFRPEEKADLISRLSLLTWPEKLRLHHLGHHVRTQ